MMFQFFFYILLIQIINLFPQKTNEINKLRNLEEELSDDIVILYLNDINCGINDTIGYDGFVLYRNELKNKYKNLITVDVGDDFQGGSQGDISFSSSIIKIKNKVGFDASTLGNHEFNYGIEQLKKLGNNITSRYICSNFYYKKNKTTIFDPYKIIEIGGKKIAFIGVLNPLILNNTSLLADKDSNGEPLYDFLTGNNSQELYTKIQYYINELKNDKKADYVILLTHIGMKKEENASDELLSKLKNVDVVIDADTNIIYNNTSKDKNGKNIYITQADTNDQSIGKIILKKDNKITSEIISEIPEPNNKINAKQIYRGNANRWVDKDLNNFTNNTWNETDDESNIPYSDIPIKDDEYHGKTNTLNESTLSPSEQRNHYFGYKKNSGLSSGSIAALVLSLVAAFVIIAVTALVCYNKFNYPNQQLPNGSNPNNTVGIKIQNNCPK